MNESILKTIKKLIGCAEDYTQFDVDIILHINTAFSTLNHLGVGPQNGYRISDESNTWDEFETDPTKLGLIKDYIYLKVKLLFDPPSSSSFLENAEKQLKEMEWRLYMMYDPITLDEEEDDEDDV
ncbi:MAG TPA: hypothetical protein DCW90_06880 [Lachnospiraceae bacterium]|nr:hypothetical protein [Lachnospiraceae bacterium]